MASIRRTRLRTARAGALLLTGLLLAGPLVGVSSASTGLRSYGGDASGFALRVVVDLSGLPASVKTQVQSAYSTVRSSLPAPAKTQLPARFPFKIDQRLLETMSQAGQRNAASAYLGTGFKQAARATVAGQSNVVNTASFKMPSKDLPILDASAGDLTAKVMAGPEVSGDASLATVSATLQAVGALLPAELQAAFGDLRSAINSAIGTTNGALDTTLGDVAGVYEQSSSLTDPLLGPVLTDTGLKPIVTDATKLASAIQLPTIPDPLATSLASIKGMKTSSAVSKSADRMISNADSTIDSTDVLGLLHVGALDLSSRSEAAGTAGSAKNSHTCSLGSVRLGRANGVSVDGKTLYVNGKAVPVPLVELSAVKKQVDDILGVAGISVSTCDAVTPSAAADGTSASQTVSAFRIEFAPRAVAAIPALGIKTGDTLLRVMIDPSVQTAVAAQVGSTTPELPHTGAGTAATIAVGIGLIAVAMFVRYKLV